MVSIIITLYNKERNIKRAIDSALNQSYSDCEVVVIDDCSTDQSIEICQGYGSNIKLFCKECNMGLPHSRKIGIENAQGDFITFLDADDYLDNNAIEQCMNYQKAQDADIVQMHIKRRITNFGLPLAFRSDYAPAKALDACLYNEQLFPVHCCGKVYKTELLHSIKPIQYNGFWGEDRVFNLPIMATSPKITVAQNAKYNYTWGGTTSSTFDVNALQSYKKVYDIKRNWALSNGYEQLLQAMQTELIKLLRYHTRQLINSKTMSQTDAENYLSAELTQPFWREFKQQPNSKELYQSEYRSLTRKIKHCITRLF